MHLTSFEKTLASIDQVCQKCSLQYAIIGGIAAIIHGLRRTTQDVDITLLIELNHIEKIGNILIKNFPPSQKDPIDFFQKHFVLPTKHKATGIPIDFTAGLSGFDKLVIQRSKRIKFGSIPVNVCSIEDLIIYKLVASRTRDMADVEELLELYYTDLDKKYLLSITEEFVQIDREDVLKNLKNLLKKHPK